MKMNNPTRSKKAKQSSKGRSTRPKLAPLAEARFTKMRPQTMKSKLDELILEFEEVAMVCTVPSTSSPAQSITVRPGASGMTRLDQFGQLYDQYRFEKMELVYRSQVSANTNGFAVVSVDYNTNDVPQNFAATQAILPRMAGKVWEDMSLSVPANRLMKSQWHFTAINTTPSGYGPVCNVNFHSTGLNGAIVGTVWMRYRVRFSGPTGATNTTTASLFTGAAGASVGSIVENTYVAGAAAIPATPSTINTAYTAGSIDGIAARVGAISVGPAMGRDYVSFSPGVRYTGSVPSITPNGIGAGGGAPWPNTDIVEAQCDFAVPVVNGTVPTNIVMQYNRATNVVVPGSPMPDVNPELQLIPGGVFNAGGKFLWMVTCRVTDYWGYLQATLANLASIQVFFDNGSLIAGSGLAYLTIRLRPRYLRLGGANQLTLSGLRNASGTKFSITPEDVKGDVMLPVSQAKAHRSVKRSPGVDGELLARVLRRYAPLSDSEDSDQDDDYGRFERAQHTHLGHWSDGCEQLDRTSSCPSGQCPHKQGDSGGALPLM